MDALFAVQYHPKPPSLPEDSSHLRLQHDTRGSTERLPTRWRETMCNIAEFILIGRVGTIKQVGKTVHVTVCANYPFKDKGGEWKDDQHWNEVTIFTKPIQDYVNEHV